MAQTYVETFNGGNNATPGIDHTWVEWEGTAWDNFSNEARCVTVGAFTNYSCRLDSACDNDRMSIEATLATWPGNANDFIMVYVNGGGDGVTTFLAWQARGDEDDYRAFYVSGGSFTTLYTTSGVGVSASDVLKINRYGRVVEFLVNGTIEFTYNLHDSQIAVLAGRRYGGLRVISGSGSRTFTIDDVTVADITTNYFRTVPTIHQPPPGALINITHPLASGLGYAWVFNEHTGVPMSLRESNPTLRVPLSTSGTGGAWGIRGCRVNNGGENSFSYNSPAWGTNSSLMIHCTVHDVTGDDAPYLSKRDAAPLANWALRKNVGGDLVLERNSTTDVTFTDAYPGAGEHQIIITNEPTAPQFKCYIDGVFSSSQTDANSEPFSSEDLNLGFDYPGGSDRFDMTIHAVYFWVWTTLSTGAVTQLWDDPWALMRPNDTLPKAAMRPFEIVTLDTLSLTLATSISVDLGEIVIALDTLGLSAAVQNLTVVPGGVSIVLDTLNITTVAETLNVANRVAVALDTLSLALGIPNLTVTIPSVTIALDTLGLAASVQDLAVVPGEVIVPVDTLGLTAAVQTLSLSLGVSVLLDTLALALGAESISVSPGAVTISLDELSLALEAIGLQVTGGPRVAPAIRTFIVEAEDRTFVISVEDRTFVVDEEDRTLTA